MTEEEIKSTYPEYTVYVHYYNDGEIFVQTWNFYAGKGKHTKSVLKLLPNLQVSPKGRIKIYIILR